MERRRLEDERRRLELEYAWALVSEVEASIKRIQERIEGLRIKANKLSAEADYHEAEAARLRSELLSMFSRVVGGGHVDAQEFEKNLDLLLDERVEAEISKFKLRLNESEIRRLQSELKRLESDLAEKRRNAVALGERVETRAKPQDILEEIKVINLKIASLGEVLEEAEDMYLVADSRYRETEIRSKEVEENLRKALEEVEYRKELWRRFLRELMKEVEPQFNSILSTVEGAGRIVLKNLEDPEKASIELYVGFRGTEPMLLNAHTHSGGERIVGTLAFLLALQKHVKSPFRAVDEFDVHLDPLNRERMMKLLISTAESEASTQYIIITPGRFPVEGDVNVLLVQNIGGRSMIGSVK